ncbi:alcohol dehydrogenase [Mycena vulgaris]|nr:alcohol dehydrogenase [Mycena vulgaris]
MAHIQNARVLFNAVPEAYPVPGKTTVYDTTQSIDLDAVPLNGGFLVKVLILSVDPYMRALLRAPDVNSSAPAYTLGQPLMSSGIGIVLRSELAGVQVGSHVRGLITHQEYIVAAGLATSMLELIEPDPKLKLSAYLGAAGLTGQSAFMAWKEYSRATKGEVAFVSGGAGAVGSIVVQIAKQAGLKVIASAGSDAKVDFIKTLGADVAFNYKTTDTREVLAKEGPIDIYWDNVGGATLDAAMEFANMHSRFIECGQISGYNTGFQPMKNPGLIIIKSMSIHGFSVTSLIPKYTAAFRAEIVPKVVSGEFKFAEDVRHGLERVGETLLAVLKGENMGKAVVVVANE